MIRNSLRAQRLVARFSSSFNEEEVGKFGKVKDWWDPNGSQRGLHAYNALRVDFVRKLTFGYGHASPGFHFLRNKKLLDVGCGPGIFAEVGATHEEHGSLRGRSNRTRRVSILRRPREQAPAARPQSERQPHVREWHAR